MKVLILSHQRAGSSNLARFLAKISNLKLGLEAFNAKSLANKGINWKYLNQDALKPLIEMHQEDYGIVKFIYGAYPNIVEEAILNNFKADKIILLERKDLKKAALSACLAENAGNWSKTAMAVPVPENKILEKAQNYAKSIENIKYYLQNNGADHIHLDYENLYNRDENQRYMQLKALVSKLDLPVKGYDKAYQKFMGVDKKINLSEMVDSFT